MVVCIGLRRQAPQRKQCTPNTRDGENRARPLASKWSRCGAEMRGCALDGRGPVWTTGPRGCRARDISTFDKAHKLVYTNLWLNILNAQQILSIFESKLILKNFLLHSFHWLIYQIGK
jgi:hypothetical protein